VVGVLSAMAPDAAALVAADRRPVRVARKRRVA